MMADKAVMSVLWHLSHVFDLGRMKFIEYSLKDYSLLPLEQRIPFLVGCHGCDWLLRLPIVKTEMDHALSFMTFTVGIKTEKSSPFLPTAMHLDGKIGKLA